MFLVSLGSQLITAIMNLQSMAISFIEEIAPEPHYTNAFYKKT
jgi:hypothetical protein